MSLHTLMGAAIRIASSVLAAGVFYAAWMAVFLLAARLHSPAVETILWLLAPVMTATGFAVGTVIARRIMGSGSDRFLRVFAWALIGCAVGAGLVYWFGPMLIVFGMFAAGVVSIALREVVVLWRKMRA